MARDQKGPPMKHRTRVRRRRKLRGGPWGKTPEEVRRLRAKYEEVPLGALREWEDNPRVNEEAVPKLMALIKQHGFAGVIVATPDGVIRAGHTRFKALVRLQGDPEYGGPLGVVWVHWRAFDSVAAADAYALSDNKANEWADWDRAKLSRIFARRRAVEIQELSGFAKAEIEWGTSLLTNKDKEEQRRGVHTFEADPVFTIRIAQIAKKDVKRLARRVRRLAEEVGYDVEIY